MSRHLNAAVAFTCIALFSAAVVIAQNANPRGVVPRGAQVEGQIGPQAGSARSTEMNADAHFASCLIGDNRNEVALAQFVQQRAENDDIRQFAAMLVRDHTKLINTLQEFAGNVDATSNQAQGGINWRELKREVDARHLQSAQRELSSKSGTEFNECYLGMQMGSHMCAVDTMEVFKGHSSAQFAQALDEGIRTAQSHVDQAKQLMKRMRGADQNLNLSDDDTLQ